MYFMHYVTLMLETNSYVRCLLVNFSKAFDVIDHGILLKKICSMSLPANVIKWLLSFLSQRNQVTKLNSKLSCPLDINTGVV